MLWWLLIISVQCIGPLHSKNTEVHAVSRRTDSKYTQKNN